MANILNNEQKVLLTAQPLTGKGNPGSVDAAPVWSSSDSSILSLEVAADGLSVVASSGAVGTVTVTVSAVSQGNALTTSIDIEVVSAPAASLNIIFGTPESK